MSASTLSSWALLIWEELKARQLEANQLFRQAGLDPAWLSDTNARFPTQKMANLWQLAWQASADDGFGLTTGNRWSPTTFHALGFAWLASASLSEALGRMARYGRLINDSAVYELVKEDLYYRFAIQPNTENFTPQQTQGVAISIQAATAALLKMCRLLLGESFSPIAIYLPYLPSSAQLSLESLARCSLHFGHDKLQFMIDRQDMEKTLSTANAELSQLNDTVIIKHLANLANSQLTDQVEQKILEMLPSGGINERSVAAALGTSERTLQRRLAEENTTFSLLLQSTREQLAKQYVTENRLAISEIAYLLGFSDQANFTRAFKRWTNYSPSEFRKQLKARSTAPQ